MQFWHLFHTEQGGTPMTVTGEDFLLRLIGAGRLALFSCLEISSGVRGQTASGVRQKKQALS
jgi:hypothetical protein